MRYKEETRLRRPWKEPNSGGKAIHALLSGLKMVSGTEPGSDIFSVRWRTKNLKIRVRRLHWYSLLIMGMRTMF